MSHKRSKNTEINRQFLGWDRHALPEAARRLREQYGQGGALDLRKVIVVVPGQRAGRRLVEVLAFLAEDEKLLFTPPEVVTEGQLPEKLYTPKRPFATDLIQDLTWAQALRDLPTEQRRHIMPHPPAESHAVRWLELGKVLRGLHLELARDALDFEMVLAKATDLANFSEENRWQALVALQRRYLDLLDEQELWDIQTARLKAIEYREINTDCDIILLGTVDLNKSLRYMLDQIAGRVTVYVVAPENLADRFDAYGCLAPGAWTDALIDLSDEQLCQVDGPVDQAEAVSAWLADLNGRYRKDEVVIGVPDESLVPQLQRELEQWGVRGRWVEGVRLGETAPYRLLAAAAQYAEHHRYADLAALFRHPDVEDWLEKERSHQGESFTLDASVTSLPAQLDQYYNAYLPSRIRASQVQANVREWPDLRRAVELIETWLEEAAASRPLRAWGDVFRTTLAAVYGERTLDLDKAADEVLHKTIHRILEGCDGLCALPDAFDTMTLSAGDAFQLALGSLADDSVPPPVDSDALEILGWLELPLDDSRALVVTSFNEGVVPTATGADTFLPDQLRRELDVLHNERRYARDAYATSVLCHSRKELRLVFARRDANNDPLQPSRLLFACPDEALLRRARRFFGDQKPVPSARRLLLAPERSIPRDSYFSVPSPVPTGEKLQRISVTRFKTYLACPYRYYLRHVRKLEAVNDAAPELDGAAFGNLLHGALGAFGGEEGAPRDSTRVTEVFEFLSETLHTLAQKQYGGAQRRPAIRVQLELAQQRLKAFAWAQVDLVRGGWRIIYAENGEAMKSELSVPFEVDEEEIELAGRIDRIDWHEAKHTLRILDYKTGDTAKKPKKTHQDKGRWIDLQLPLYRHLWRDSDVAAPADSTVELGYFNLPKKLEETDFVLAKWDDADLASADEEARRVIRHLRKERFREPKYPPPPYFEDFAAICLDNVHQPATLGDDEQGGAE